MKNKKFEKRTWCQPGQNLVNFTSASLVWTIVARIWKLKSPFSSTPHQWNILLEYFPPFSIYSVHAGCIWPFAEKSEQLVWSCKAVIIVYNIHGELWWWNNSMSASSAVRYFPSNCNHDPSSWSGEEKERYCKGAMLHSQEERLASRQLGEARISAKFRTDGHELWTAPNQKKKLFWSRFK